MKAEINDKDVGDNSLSNDENSNSPIKDEISESNKIQITQESQYQQINYLNNNESAINK